MFRLVMSAGLALSFATPVLADAKHRETCVETAKIVHIAVAQRAGGMKPNRIKRGMTQGKNQVGERFIPTVGPLVDWVFSIDGGAVRSPDAPKLIAGKYRTDCLAYKP